VFFEEPAVFLVRFQQGLPDIMRRDRHPFPPGVQKRSHRRNNYHNWAVEAKRQEMWVVASFRLMLPAQPVDATPSSALIRQCFCGRSFC
jgi:hypothetical protein